MEQPKHLQTIIDRYDTRIVQEETPVLHGSYRTIYRVFIAITIAQIAYAFAGHWSELRYMLEGIGLNVFAPVYGRLAVLSYDEGADIHLHMLVAATAIWSVASIQEKEYGIVRWTVVLIGTLAVNYGLLPWLGDKETLFVLYWACLAFILGHVLSAKLVDVLARRKEALQVGEVLYAGAIIFVLWFGLARYPLYVPSALAGGLLGAWIALKRPEASL